jgi:hypothetical protein
VAKDTSTPGHAAATMAFAFSVIAMNATLLLSA